MSGNLWDGFPAGKQLPGMIENSENDSETEELPKKNDEMRVTGELLNILTSLNHSGRVDYALKPNLLEVDVISALKSHVSYFEETDIAGFVMMELLKEHQRAEEIVAKKI